MNRSAREKKYRENSTDMHWVRPNINMKSLKRMQLMWIMCIFLFFLHHRIYSHTSHCQRLWTHCQLLYYINNKWKTDTSIQLYLCTLRNATGIAIYLLVLMIKTGKKVAWKWNNRQEKKCVNTEEKCCF